MASTFQTTGVDSLPAALRDGGYSYLPSLSPAMKAVERLVADVAPTDIPILLVGESGTGKDVLAHQLHQLSQRGGALLKVSCSTLTMETLPGLLKGKANGNGKGHGAGTLFLDEICDLDSACQARLLSALPDGSNGTADGLGPVVSSRLVCATARHLEEQLKAGRFREELYFRINGVCLRLPPLRHRREDIPVLLDFFVEKFAAEFGRRIPTLEAEVYQAAAESAWPGNVREMENFARKVVLLGDGRAALAELEGAHVPASSESTGAVSLKEASRAASRQAERELILKTLARTRWNRKRAAQELQISYKALLYKLKDIGLEDSPMGPRKEG